MANLKDFAYWINERHKIYLKKSQGMNPPWTEDPILREYKFTNVFRQLDFVTRRMNQLIDFPSYSSNPEPYMDYVFDVIVFRMFNHPETYIHWIYNDRNMTKFRKALKLAKKNGNQIFTGAYIITNNGKKDDKIDLVIDALKKIKPRVGELIIHGDTTLQGMHEIVMTFPMCGPFVAYEIITDFRHTLFSHASDIYTWANAGPGAFRGLNRIHGRELKKRISQKQACEEMHWLMEKMNYYKEWWVPDLEMRDIEHSLCEFDKYMRVKNKEGRPRSKYDYSKYKTTSET